MQYVQAAILLVFLAAVGLFAVQNMQAIKVESYSLDDMTVRVFGQTGVVAGRWETQ